MDHLVQLDPEVLLDSKDPQVLMVLLVQEAPQDLQEIKDPMDPQGQWVPRLLAILAVDWRTNVCDRTEAAIKSVWTLTTATTAHASQATGCLTVSVSIQIVEVVGTVICTTR
jgi:hypothetical protein